MVPVLDWIICTFQSANGATPNSTAYGGVVVRRADTGTHEIFRAVGTIPSILANGTTQWTVDVEFSGGFPLFHEAVTGGSGGPNLIADHIKGSAWTGAEVAAVTAQAGAGQTLSTVCFTIGYHYENVSDRRSANIGS